MDTKRKEDHFNRRDFIYLNNTLETHLLWVFICVGHQEVFFYDTVEAMMSFLVYQILQLEKLK